MLSVLPFASNVWVSKEAALDLIAFPYMAIRLQKPDVYREFSVPFGSGPYILRYYYDKSINHVIITNV